MISNKTWNTETNQHKSQHYQQACFYIYTVQKCLQNVYHVEMRRLWEACNSGIFNNDYWIYPSCKLPTIVAFLHLNLYWYGRSQHMAPKYLYSNRQGLVAQWLERWTSYPKVAGSIPTEVGVMIFRSLGVDKLGWTSSMIIKMFIKTQYLFTSQTLDWTAYFSIEKIWYNAGVFDWSRSFL